LNQTLAVAAPPKPPIEFRLAFENKIQEGMAVWNRVSSYEQLIKELPIMPEEKKQMKSLLKAQGLLKMKPVPAEFIPQQRKFVMHFSKGDESIILLSMAPTVIAFNGESIIEVFPKSSILDIVKPKKNKSIKKPVKGAFLWWTLVVPEAQAQLYTNEQIIAMEQQNQQLAQQQTSLAKNILLAAGLAFGGFLLGAWLWGRYAHHLNPNWGLEAKSREREDWQQFNRNKQQLTQQYPELERVLFQDTAKLRFFKCAETPAEGKASRPSPVEKLSFISGDLKEKNFDFMSKPEELNKSIQAKDEYSEKIDKVNFCCMTPPCGQWLAEQLISRPPPNPEGPAESVPSSEASSQKESPPITFESSESSPGNK
jgi:hypothetical protein